MHPLDTSAALAAEAVRDRLELARRSRLARLARCCHPSAWLRLVRRVEARLRPTQRTSAPAACCA
jgi:hypothetical protein